MSKLSFERFFPHKKIRPQQKDAIEFTLKSFQSDKKFVILELGTGCGKSAIGVTTARYMNAVRPEPIVEKNNKGDDVIIDPYLPGAYTLTTQKILQQQYINDFGAPKGGMVSIRGSDNYQCKYYASNSCGESLRLLKNEKKGSPFWNSCIFNCNYKKAKETFIKSHESVTNFSYFLTETMYVGSLKPRDLLIIDEAHNTESELSKFIEVVVSERFARDVLKVAWPTIKSQKGVVSWIRDAYVPKLKFHIEHIEKMLDKFKGLKEKLDDFVGLAKQFEMLDKHICKIERFLSMHNEDNWVMNSVAAEGRSLKKFEFKPVKVGPYTEDLLFKFGEKVILMSATIVNKDVFCDSLGIKSENCAFLSIDSPFPIENRPIYYTPAGMMSAKDIDITLPKLVEIIKIIIDQHKRQKGIIHTHTYKIANYIKKNIRSGRLIIHDSENRDEMVQKHMSSNKDTILLSPSLAEGIDLKDELSEFQILCKVPFPYLGDKLVKKRMHARKEWYPYQTAKTVIQSVGRSIRHKDDKAITYILDENWERFYNKNKNMFPESFRKAIQK